MKHLMVVLLALFLVACDGKTKAGQNVFPVNVPTPAKFLSATVYCVDNISEYADVRFDGANYFAVDYMGNITIYPITSKVEQSSCK